LEFLVSMPVNQSRKYFSVDGVTMVSSLVFSSMSFSTFCIWRVLTPDLRACASTRSHSTAISKAFLLSVCLVVRFICRPSLSV
jgi:hypothetical protein